MTSQPAISPTTKLCAIIGDPVAHSLSPAIHNAAFTALGLDFVYVAFQVKDLKNALAGMRALNNFRGMSVTIPHKIEAMDHMDHIAPVDRRIGSINTIINDNGRLSGLGTDGPGALKALTDAGVSVDGKNVLILGSGGAARAIAFSLVHHTQLERLTLLDIDTAQLTQLAADLSTHSQAMVASHPLNSRSLAAAMAEAHVIIHCTPVGMHPETEASLVPPELFQPHQVLFDIVYTPLETRLLTQAKASGLTVISGVEMFIHQAVLQFEQFTGKPAPVEIMRRVVMKQLRESP